MFCARSPFDKRLSNACMKAITKHVNELFDRAPTLADAIAQLPFNGEPCFAGWDDGLNLRYTVYQALC
jgi:hypothetical protein